MKRTITLIAIIMAIALFSTTAWAGQVDGAGNEIFYGNIEIEDGKMLYLGTDGDAYCGYDEATDNRVECDGADIFWANAHISADDTTYCWGSDQDFCVEYDEDGTNQARITGSAIFEDRVEMDFQLQADGGVKIIDNVDFILGTGSDGTLYYDEAGDDMVHAAGTAHWQFENHVAFNGGAGMNDDEYFNFGDGNDVDMFFDSGTSLLNITGVGWVFESASLKLIDDKTWVFGTDDNGTIGYDETTDDKLEITCATGIGLSGAITTNSTLTSTATGALGWSVVAGADTACTTTCTSAAVFGFDSGTTAIVAPDSALADMCVCAGAS